MRPDQPFSRVARLLPTWRRGLGPGFGSAARGAVRKPLRRNGIATSCGARCMCTTPQTPTSRRRCSRGRRASIWWHDHPAALRGYEIANVVVGELVARPGHGDVVPRTTDNNLGS